MILLRYAFWVLNSRWLIRVIVETELGTRQQNAIVTNQATKEGGGERSMRKDDR